MRYETLLRASEKAAVEEKVNAYLAAKPPEGVQSRSKVLPVAAGKEVKLLRVQIDEAKLTIAKIMEENEKMKAEIKEGRKQISAIRERIRSRAAMLDEHGHGLANRRAMAEEKLQKEMKRTKQRWSLVQAKIADARSYLCYEAASLYSLKQRRRRGGVIEYYIGGNPIPSLNELPVHSTILTTTTFGHLCNLLMLISDYCGIKLPYEVTLPGKYNEYPTIKAPSSSNPRLLHLNIPLTTLSRDNSNNYILFLEGASMLAYNVAWLCLTQGLEVSSVDEAMHPGKNLYTLLIGGGHGPSNNFGRWSHATTGAGFLGGPEGNRLIWEWNVDIREIVKKLEMVVHSQNMKQEWDLVEEIVGEDEEETFSGLEKTGRDKKMQEGYRVEPSGWTKVKPQPRG